jgi:hypothetical protein
VRVLTGLVAAVLTLPAGTVASIRAIALLLSIDFAALMLGLILDRWLTLRRHTERTPQ